jgi:LPXTG-motif cell wall-anchored protein
MNDLTSQASSTGMSSGLIALIIGVIVVILLIAAFALGSRRKEKEPPPTAPTAPDLTPGNGPPASDSWSTPASTPGQAPQGRTEPGAAPRHSDQN